MEKILSMLEEIRPEHDFTQSEDFIEDGLLDSFDLISLIDMLEGEYHIVIDGLDVLPENLCSTEAIANLVKKSGGNV